MISGGAGLYRHFTVSDSSATNLCESEIEKKKNKRNVAEQLFKLVVLVGVNDRVQNSARWAVRRPPDQKVVGSAVWASFWRAGQRGQVWGGQCSVGN